MVLEVSNYFVKFFFEYVLFLFPKNFFIVEDTII